MRAIYDLKQMLCDELEEYGKRGDLSAGSLEIVDKLAHALKNLNKIIEDDEGYSGYSRTRDSRGRYSRTGEFAERLREMSHAAPDEHTRQEMERLASKLM